MNHYGRTAMEHWSKVAPSRFAALENPEEFFSTLGEEVLSQVDALSVSLQGNDPENEGYLEKVARLNAAKKQAEEIVLSDLVWIPEELSPELAREEWEATRPMDESLVAWAWNVQDHPENAPSTDELEAMAATWSLTPEFLQQLIDSESPSQFLEQNAETMAASVEARWAAFQTQLQHQ